MKIDDRDPCLVLEASGAAVSWVWRGADGELHEGSGPGRASQQLAASLARLPADKLHATRIIWVGVGPGSFTGIRAAIATALGLRQIIRAEIRAVRSCHGLATRFRTMSRLGVVHDARRGDWFLTRYDCGKMSQPTEVLPASEARVAMERNRYWVCSDNLSGGEALLNPTSPPTASEILAYLDCEGWEPDLELSPIHLRQMLS